METTKRQVFRSRDRILGGVCGGVADYLGLEPARVRLAMCLLALFAGFSFWVYLLLWLVIPQEPACINS